ncbi:hypothetical protein HYE66_06815 [Aggregatibacter actinomycetemcomitans]|nr:hypothetical protein [Aggregatibacter actinomycetemcomitans]
MKYKTFVALFALALSTTLQATPQFRFGELLVQPDKVEIYRQAIHTDIADTLPNEQTAFTMYALPKAAQPNDFFVVEIYQDAAAEQVHRAKPWYKKFVADTQGIYLDRQLIEVEPRFILEAPAAITLENNTPARVSRYRATENNADLTPVFKQQRGQLTNGRIATYLVQSTTNSALWYVIDVYRDNAALQADAVPTAFNNLAKLEQRDEIQNGVMANKGGLSFDKK